MEDLDVIQSTTYKTLSNKGYPLRQTAFYKKGTKIRHNPYGPALIQKYGNYIIELWLIDGKLHRVGAPAVIGENPITLSSSKEYYRVGKLHNQDGPAIIRNSIFYKDEVSYYLKGVELTKDEWEAQRRLL